MRKKINYTKIICIIVVSIIINTIVCMGAIKKTKVRLLKSKNNMYSISISSDDRIIYVSKTGNDSNDGLSENTPKQTIQSAVNLAGQYIKTQNVIIEINSGDYYIDSPINITEQNTSGDKKFKLVLYGSGDVNIDGGTKLTDNWTNEGNNIWSIQLQSNITSVNGLYINNVKKELAKELVSTDRSDIKYEYTNSQDYSQGLNYAYLEINNNEVNLDYNAIKNSVSDLILYDQWEWKYSLLKASSIEQLSNGNIKLDFSDDTINALRNKNPRQNIFHTYNSEKMYLANSKSLLNSEGEYYYDKSSSKLYYYSSQSPNGQECIIPKAEALLNIRGSNNTSTSSATLASNVDIVNINFKNSASSKNLELFNGIQTDCGWTSKNNNYSFLMRDASINLEYASNITIDSCDFRNINSTVLAVNDYTYNVTINNNVFKNNGGSGIRVGTINEVSQNTQKDQRNIPSDTSNVYTVSTSNSGINYMPCKISITDNLINNIGNEYYMSVGVGIFFANTVNVKNNTISNIPYTGISAGWGWVNRNNQYITKKSGNINIEANQLLGVMKKLADGSGIYTLRIF